MLRVHRMCGIVGYVGYRPASELLLDGLSRLEYRGYDSAGIAVVQDRDIAVRKRSGRVAGLIQLVESHPVNGSIGIGHTRWATHGIPNEVNAHPHATSNVALVHNGIIENFKELKAELARKKAEDEKRQAELARKNAEEEAEARKLVEETERRRKALRTPWRTSC